MGHCRTRPWQGGLLRGGGTGDTKFPLYREANPGPLGALHYLLRKEQNASLAKPLSWLAEQGVRISGIDISQEALSLCHKVLKHKGLGKNIDTLTHGSASDIACPDEYFDGIIESCVFQHLPSDLRVKAFSEVVRLLKPGGLFIGHMLNRKHTTYKKQLDKIIGRHGKD